MAVGSFFFGSGPKTVKTPIYEQNQLGALNGALGQAQSGLGLQGGMQDGMNPVEQQYTRNFAQNTVPGLAERFTSMGGGQHSSAFQGALGQAGAGLNEDLASLRQSHLMNLLNIGLKPQNEYAYQGREHGLLGNLALGVTGGLASGFGDSGGQALGQAVFGGLKQGASNIFSKINPAKFQSWLQQNPNAMQQWQ
jgi:hypothetical protein